MSRKHSVAQTRTAPKVHYKTVKVGNLDVFYREAGREDAPGVLLLHGWTALPVEARFAELTAGIGRLSAPTPILERRGAHVRPEPTVALRPDDERGPG